MISELRAVIGLDRRELIRQERKILLNIGLVIMPL